MVNYEVLNDFDVKNLSSIKIGGTIKSLYKVYTKQGLKEVITLLNKSNSEYYVIGGCSKILFPDFFLRDALVQMSNNYITKKGNVVIVGAGTPLKKLSSYMINNGFKGFEGLLSIPGQLGGAIVNNAGAYGNEIKDYLVSVTCLKGNKIITLKKDDLKFSYRSSIFKSNNNFIIIEAKFKTIKTDQNLIVERSKENAKKRVISQPQNILTLGSTFKNCMGHVIAQELDNLGVKGLEVGGISVSNKHANFLINNGNSTQKNFLNILVILRTLVYNKLRYNADFEVVILRW